MPLARKAGRKGQAECIPLAELGGCCSQSCARDNLLWHLGGGGTQKQGMLHVAGQCVSAPHGPQSSHSLLSPFLLFAAALGLTEKLVNLNLSGKAKLVSMGKSLQEEMEALLGPDGVLLYPSHPIIAPKHHSPICMPFNFAYTGEQP